MDKLAQVLERIKTYEPEKVILFGSYARSEVDEQSDLDLVVIKRTDKRFLERLIEVAKIVGPDFGKVDIFVYTPEEFRFMQESGNPFIENVLKEGKVLY
jgi:predicted nucleotidyltransferase